MSADLIDFPGLMRASLAGDKAAYSKVLHETSQLLQPLLHRTLYRDSDRQDVLQEILISIHKARHTYDGNRPYKPWAYAIAKFRLSDFLRKHYKDRLRQSVDLEEAENIPEIDVTKSGFTYESISELLGRLPKKQAVILELLHKDGLTIKETAQKIGMTETAVKVAAHRAYKMLRKKLMEQEIMTTTKNLIEKLSAETDIIKPVSPLATSCWWALGVLVYIGVMVAHFGLRDDLLSKFPMSLLTAELGLLVLLIMTTALSALLLSYPDMYQKGLLAFSPVFVFVAFLLVLVLEYISDVPPSPLPEHGKECLICISGLSLIPAAFLFYRMRKFASVHFYMAGAIAALSAFSIGALILRLAEKTDSIPHVVTWHYLPMVGVTLIGVVLGRLILKW